MEELLVQKAIGSHLALQSLCLRHSLEVAGFRKVQGTEPWLVRALAYRFFELYAYRREHDKFIEHYLQVSIALREQDCPLAPHLAEPVFEEFSQTLKKARNFDPLARLLQTLPAADRFVCAFIRMIAIKAQPRSPQLS
jgi:hypothetical protein